MNRHVLAGTITTRHNSAAEASGQYSGCQPPDDHSSSAICKTREKVALTNYGVEFLQLFKRHENGEHLAVGCYRSGQIVECKGVLGDSAPVDLSKR